MSEHTSGDHLCYGTYGELTFIMNRGRRAAYHRTPDN